MHFVSVFDELYYSSWYPFVTLMFMFIEFDSFNEWHGFREHHSLCLDPYIIILYIIITSAYFHDFWHRNLFTKPNIFLSRALLADWVQMWTREWDSRWRYRYNHGDGKRQSLCVYGVYMGPTRGPQDPGGPHVGPTNLVIWDEIKVLRYVHNLARQIKP